jgi:hypothetical protein
LAGLLPINDFGAIAIFTSITTKCPFLCANRSIGAKSQTDKDLFEGLLENCFKGDYY